MKRTSAAFVIIVLIVLSVGCANNSASTSELTNTTKSQVETSAQKLETDATGEVSSQETESNIPVEISTQKFESDVPTESGKLSELKINANVITVDKYEMLDVENITFKQYASGTTVNRPLFPTVFDDNNIYVISEYYTLAEKETTQNAISSFNILSKERKELFSYDFSIGYNPDFIYNEHYFTFPCTHNEYGELQINIIDYDKENDVSENIYYETVTSPYYYADYLNETEVVFLIFPKIGEKIYQRVLKYDFVTSEISVLYENEYIHTENENNVAENIWTIDTFNGNVFILNTEVSAGNRSWSILEIDSSGNVLEQTDLTGLYDYRAINCSINQFVVAPKEYLIQFYDAGINSPFVAINRNDSDINLQFDKLVPCTLISPFWLEERYLLYSTFPDYGDYDEYHFSSDISVYDSLENEFYFLNIQTDPKYQIDKIVSNEKGDVILVVSDDTDIFQYLLISDILSYVK